MWVTRLDSFDVPAIQTHPTVSLSYREVPVTLEWLGRYLFCYNSFISFLPPSTIKENFS